MLKRMISTTVLATTVGLVPATGAGAATASPTKLTISHSGQRFTGRVKSAQAACVAGRRVTVYRKKAGPDAAIGTGAASASGRWSVALGGRIPAGTYYARAKSVKAPGATCRSARSVTTHAS